MSSKCIHIQCKRTSRALCKCCNQDLCLQHFWQHNDSIISQLNTLKKDINEVDCRFKFLDVSKSITNFRQQLKQWRVNSYNIVDKYYEEKCQEFNKFIKDKIDNQRETINQLQKRIDEFIETEYGNQQDFDLIRTNIKTINEKIQTIEQTPFPITILPLVINENLIQIKN